MQGAGLVEQENNQRNLIGSRRRARLSREQNKTRVVLAMILEMRLQDRAAIDFRGAPAGDGRPVGIAGVDHFADASARILRGYTSDLGMRLEEARALCQRHGL